MDKEKEIQQYMKALSISKEEAEQLWEDDHSDEILPEVAEMEEKAKTLKRHYEQGEKKTRKPSTRERKVDNVKKYIFDIITASLKDVVEIISLKTETELTFHFKEETYTLKLTKHRKPKQ